MCRQEEAETGEEGTAEAAEEKAAAAGEDRSCRMLTIGDCELRSLLIKHLGIEWSCILQTNRRC